MLMNVITILSCNWWIDNIFFPILENLSFLWSFANSQKIEIKYERLKIDIKFFWNIFKKNISNIFIIASCSPNSEDQMRTKNDQNYESEPHD